MVDINDLFDEEPDWFANDDDDDDEIGDGENNGSLAVAHHVVLLIDCASSMFEPVHPDPEFPEERLSSVQFALNTVQDTIRKKIRQVTVHKSGKRDGIGVLLYNTKYRLPLVRDENVEDDEEESETRHSDKQKEENGSETEEDDDDDDDDAFVPGMGGPKMSTVHELLPLQPPGIRAVKKLRSTQPDMFTDEILLDLAKEYCNDDDDNKEMGEDESSTLVPLQDALYEAQKCLMDAKCVKEGDDRAQIWIVTANDCPHGKNLDVILFLQTTVADLRDRGWEVVVWPVLPPSFTSPESSRSSSWDESRFYDLINVRTEQQEAENEELPWTVSVLKKTRRSYRVPLLLPNWKAKDDNQDSSAARIVLDLYRLTLDLKIPRGVPIHNQTGKRLSRITEGVTESGTVLYTKSKFAPTQPSHSRIRKFYEFGGETVPFSEEDKIAIKKQCNANSDFPSLILLGFKPAESIPFYHFLKNPFLVYPNDEACRGSADAFAHLHASMLRKKVVGVGEFLYRIGAISFFVALFPVEEELDVVGHGDNEDEAENCRRFQSRPPGMRMVRIPFEDEIRAIAPDAATQTYSSTGADVASEALVEVALNLMERQNINAKIGEDFENPAVEKYWDYIEALALEEGKKAGRTFDTELDESIVMRRAGAEIEQFCLLLPDDAAVEKKRKAKSLENDDTGMDWVSLWRNDELSTCKVPQLKTFLGSRGEPKTGRKEELIERVSKILGAEANCTVKIEGDDSGPVEII